MQRGAFHPRHKLHNTGIANIQNQLVDDVVPKLAVCHLASTEAQTSFHLVALGEKANRLPLFGLVVVLVNRDRELDLFDQNDFLLLFGGAVALFLLVEKASVILNAANGRNRVRRDFDEVEAVFAGNLQGIKYSQDAELFAVLVNDANFTRANTVVDANKCFSGTFIECDGSPPAAAMLFFGTSQEQYYAHRVYHSCGLAFRHNHIAGVLLVKLCRFRSGHCQEIHSAIAVALSTPSTPIAATFTLSI